MKYYKWHQWGYVSVLSLYMYHDSFVHFHHFQDVEECANMFWFQITIIVNYSSQALMFIVTITQGAWDQPFLWIYDIKKI